MIPLNPAPELLRGPRKALAGAHTSSPDLHDYLPLPLTQCKVSALHHTPWEGPLPTVAFSVALEVEPWSTPPCRTDCQSCWSQGWGFCSLHKPSSDFRHLQCNCGKQRQEGYSLWEGEEEDPAILRVISGSFGVKKEQEVYIGKQPMYTAWSHPPLTHHCPDSSLSSKTVG